MVLESNPLMPADRFPANMREVVVIDLGTIPHADANLRMRELQQLRLGEEIPDTLLFCDHPEIVTLGPAARRDAVTAPDDYAQVEVDRGGSLTYHGPGQLVVYPVFRWDLEGESNVKRVTAKLEAWCIEALAEFNIVAGRDERMQGVWSDGHKVGSVGLAFRNWVSRHGFTLNLATTPGRVEGLHGCGLEPGVTTCLLALGHRVSRPEMTTSLLRTMPSAIGRVEAKS